MSYGIIMIHVNQFLTKEIFMSKAKHNMKKILFWGLVLGIMSITTCNQQTRTTNQQIPEFSHGEKEAFKNIKVDNTNDLVCGMTLTAGIGDTAHYNGKVYGFCSKGCKDKFVKSPTEYISAQ